MTPIGEGSYEVWIFDSAWEMDPAFESSHFLPRSGRNFQGTVAHELTHVATYINPQIRTLYNVTLKDGSSPIGEYYDYTDYDFASVRIDDGISGYEQEILLAQTSIVESEEIAMTVATYMYRPGLLGKGGVVNWAGGLLGNPNAGLNWRYSFVEAAAQEIDGE